MEGDFLDPFRWGVWLFIIIGAAALAGAVYWTSRRVGLFLRGSRAPGKVVGSESSSDSDGKRSYRPVVEFLTPDGQARRVIGSTGSSGGSSRVGRKVTVIYDPADPDRAFINTFVQGWLGPLGVAIFGAGFLGLGMMALAALDMPDDLDQQIRTQQDKLQSRLETTREDSHREERDEDGHKPNVDVPSDLFAKPKR